MVNQASVLEGECTQNQRVSIIDIHDSCEDAEKRELAMSMLSFGASIKDVLSCLCNPADTTSANHQQEMTAQSKVLSCSRCLVRHERLETKLFAVFACLDINFANFRNKAWCTVEHLGVLFGRQGVCLYGTQAGLDSRVLGKPRGNDSA